MAQLFYGETLADLYSYSRNFSSKVSVSPGDFFVPAQLSTDLVAATAAFSSAYETALEPDTRTKVSIQVRDAAMRSLLTQLRYLIKMIGGNPQISDIQRTELGIKIRRRPVRRTVPTLSPDIDILARGGTMVRIRLHSGAALHRGRPVDTDGAVLFTHVGAEPPAMITAWVTRGFTGKAINEIEFDAALPAGTKVWFTAFYYNSAGSGPGAEPVSTVLAGGSTMRLAA